VKIRDKVALGVIAGLAGNVVKTAIDEVSLRQKISQRSFRETASGVWVSKRKEAAGLKGQILGSLFDFGLSSLGGVGIVFLLAKTGKDHLVLKGTLSGITIGSGVTALISGIPGNKIKSKDAASNLSYMFAHGAYGAAAAATAGLLGDPGLFKKQPAEEIELIT